MCDSNKGSVCIKKLSRSRSKHSFFGLAEETYSNYNLKKKHTVIYEKKVYSKKKGTLEEGQLRMNP